MYRYFLAAALTTVILLASAANAKDRYRIAWQNAVTGEEGHSEWTTKTTATFGVARLQGSNPSTVYRIEKQTKKLFFIPWRPKTIMRDDLFRLQRKKKGGPIGPPLLLLTPALISSGAAG